MKTKGKNSFRVGQAKRLLSLFIAFVFVLGIVFSGFTQTVSAVETTIPSEQTIPTYLNPTAAVEDRVSDLLSRMSLDEKVGQMLQPEKGSISIDDVTNYYLGSVLSSGGSFPESGTEAESTMENWSKLYDSMQDAALSTRLGIPILYGVDAVHGHNNVKGATIFPHSIGLGATRDVDLVERIGAAVAEEVKATGVNWTFAPTIVDPQNIRWGRTYEGFGDNLNLVAQMGVAYTKGLQGATINDLKKSDKVVATVKHFIGEGWTDNGSNQGNVTSMTKEEVATQLIKPYADAVAAGARSVMASFSSINGVKCHASKYLLTDILKEKDIKKGGLGFDGIVVTDYNGIEQIGKDEEGNTVTGLKLQLKVGINAGVDMLMETGNWKNCINNIKELVAADIETPGSGIAMSRIDDAVSRILRVKFQAGLFESSKTDPTLASKFGSQENRNIAREAVRKSLVLLKNDKVNDTPILSQLKDMNKIFVAGKNANDLGNQCGGWTITWQGKSGNSLTTGTTILKGIQDAVAGTNKTVTYNKNGRVPTGSEVAIVVIGETPYSEGNGDRANLELSTEDKATLQNVKESGVPTIVILVSGRPMIINDYLNDWDGFIEAWLPGTEGKGVADVLFGDYDFTGKLSVKWPFYTEVLPIADDDSPYILFKYGYGLKKATETPALPVVPESPRGSLPTGVTAINISPSATTTIEAENPYEVSGWDLNNPGNNFVESGSGRSGGKSIGWTSAGNWLKYFVSAAEAGWYKVDFGIASPDGATGAIQLRDGTGAVLCTVNAAKTGSWGTWGSMTSYVQLPAGEQIIQFYCVKAGFNFDYMNFTKVAGPLTDPTVPAPIYTGTVVAAAAVENWMSTEVMASNTNWYWRDQYSGGENKLTKQSNLDVSLPDQTNVTTIKIDPSKEYQTMMGIGTSLEGSSIHNILKMSEAKREEILKALVDPNSGTGMSMMRLTIGTPDFVSGEFYSYDDMPKGQTDVNLEHFSIDKDKDASQNIVQIAKQARDIAANQGVDLKFFASPWSPPGWMKTSDSLMKGQIKDEYLPALANYYLKYLQAYKNEGIDIEAMTLQNEPLLEIEYPSCKMTWQQEAQLSKLLRKAIDDYNAIVSDAQKLDVKLWIFDHNPGDTMTYPAQILKDNVIGAYDAVDGTAFHDYGGDLGEMSKLHNMYPDKDIYLTERAVWGTTGADRMALYFRNWARSYNSWVFMLDSDIATHHWTGTPDPTPFVQDAGNPDNYWMLPEVYITGQYTKFVKPGYIRIDSNYGSASTVTNVTFMSPDKKQIVAVVINKTGTEQHFKMLSDGGQIGATIPAKTVATYVWNRENFPGEVNDVVSGGGEIAYTPSTTITLKAGTDSIAESTFEWTRADDGKLKGGTSGVSFANYIIDIPEAGDYAVDVKYNGAGTRTFGIESTSGAAISTSGDAILTTGAAISTSGDAISTTGAAISTSGDTISTTGAAISTSGYAISTSRAAISIVAPASSTSNQWEPQNTKSKRGIIHLEQGTQNIKLALLAQDGWTDVDSLCFTKLQGNFTVPVKIDALQADSYNNLVVYSTSDNVYAFGNISTDSSMSYKVNVPEGRKYSISYKVATDNSDAKIKLKINNGDTTTPAAISVPQTGSTVWTTVTDRVYLPAGNLTLTVSADTSAFNFGGLTIGLIRPELEATTGYSLDGQVINLSLVNSVFVKENVSGITLSGTAVTDGGLIIKTVKYIDPTHVRINLGWEKTFTVDGQVLTINVPSNAFTNSTEGNILTTSIAGKSTINNSVAITDLAKINAENYYLMDGITVATSTNGGNQVQFGEGGGWVDYFVDVAETNDYTINMKINPNNAFSESIQLMEGINVLCSFNTPSVDNKWVDLRRTIHLTAGQHHLKLFANMGSFNVNWLSIEPKAVQTITDAEGISRTIEAESYFNSDRIPIEGNNNLGYVNAGNYSDYYLDVPTSANYTVTYKYTTAQGGCSVSLVDIVGTSTVELSKTSLPATGGWSNYTTIKGAVYLTQGIHTIRLIDNGDGFNMDSFNFTEGVEGSIPSLSKVATPDVSLIPGVYNTATPIELSCVTSGADIYYTLDGTLPTTTSTKYTVAIQVDKVSSIRAIAVKAGMTNSSVVSYTYVIAPSGLPIQKVETPQVSPSEGTYSTPQNIIISSTAGANIYYTLDGSKPTRLSTVYTAPICVSSTTTIKVLAIKRGMVNSELVTFTFTISSGSGTPYVPTAPVPETQKDSEKPLVTTYIKVNGNTLTTIVEAKELDKAFGSARVNKEGIKTVAVEVKAVEGIVNYLVEIPTSTLTSTTANKLIEIRTPKATLLIPENMLDAKAMGNSKFVELCISAADISKFSDEAKKQIGNKPVVELSMKLDGKAIEWNNPNVPITVSIDYVPTAEELKNAEHIVVHYIDANGNFISVPSGRYNSATGKVTFTTTHFSKYALSFVEKTYSDIKKYSWAIKPIEVLASKGVLDGITEDVFNPGKAITREECIAWLVRALGITAEVTSNFDDLGDSKYSKEIGIAKKLSITSGVGDNNFAPKKAITRQDLMKLTCSALEVAKKKLDKGNMDDLVKFTDAYKTSSYAIDSVAALVTSGIIVGSDNSINPKGNTTRAEASVIMYKLYNR